MNEEELEDLIDSKFDFGQGIGDKFYDNEISEHKIDVLEGINEKGIDNLEDAKEFINEYMENEFTDKMNSYVENVDIHDEIEFSDAINAIQTGFVDESLKDELTNSIEGEIKVAIEDSFDMDGHIFDNQTEFHEAVNEDFGLENADLINEVKDYGLEEVIESQVDAFELSHLSDSLQAEVADYTTNSEILEALAEFDDRYVQNNVAGNENTTEETLINLAENTDYPEVLETLANRDEVSEELKQAIVENPNVSEETFENMDRAAMLENDFQALNVNDQVDIATDGQFNNDNDKQTESGSMRM